MAFRVAPLTGRGESCNDEWELVLMEGGEEAANCNCGAGDPGREAVHIALKRRRVTKKDSHISNVMFIFSCLECGRP